VRERYGVDPKQVPDFIALRGDPSDKIPGAKGVGEKGAADLVGRFGSLEAMLADGRFAAQAEELRLYRAIATMDAKAPLPSLVDQTPTWAKAAALARSWELNQLADRFATLVRVIGLESRPVQRQSATTEDRVKIIPFTVVIVCPGYGRK
jgi:DNA polymerase-1